MEIDRRIASLEREIEALRAAKASGPWSYDEWVRERSDKALFWEAPIVPESTYPEMAGTLELWRIRAVDEDRGFLPGHCPVFMRGSRLVRLKRESRKAGYMAEEMFERIIRRERRTIWRIEEWADYCDEVFDRIWAHFRRRSIYIHDNTVRSIVGVSPGSTIRYWTGGEFQGFCVSLDRSREMDDKFGISRAFLLNGKTVEVTGDDEHMVQRAQTLCKLLEVTKKLDAVLPKAA